MEVASHAAPNGERHKTRILIVVLTSHCNAVSRPASKLLINH